jgi:hypothetical protein
MSIQPLAVRTEGDLIRVVASDQVITAAGGAGGGVTDHGALTGLADNDHPQYALASTLAETVRDTIGSALVAGANITITVNDAGDTITIAAAGGGVTDHGALTGLGDDDHPQYLLTAGAAEFIRDTMGTGLVAGANITITVNDAGDTITIAAAALETILIDVSGDETTALTTGTNKRVFRMPFAMTVTGVKSTLTTASTSGLPTVDINEGGVSILSTKLTIDVNEKTSATAATSPVISDTALANDAEITIDVDTAGTGAAGLKVYMSGTRS